MHQRMHVLILIALVTGLGLVSMASAADPSLVGWWRFDETSGTVAADSSGNGNDATLHGDPQWVPGSIRGAVQIDGDGDYLEAAPSESLNVTGDQITLTAWVYFDDVSVVQIILAKVFNNTTHTSPYFSYGLHILSNGRGRCWLSLTSNTQSYAMAPTGTVTAGQWHHMAGVYDGSQIRLYLNGEVVATVNATGDINPYPDTIYRMGNNGGLTEPMAGKLDDIRIYTRALSVDELLDVMAGVGAETEFAMDPVPTNEASDVARDAVLSWTAGEFAATHDVYLGTSFDDVNNASRSNPMGMLVSQGQSGTSYDPTGLLGLGQTYYWRVDEVNAPPSSTIFKGAVWSFTSEPVAYPVTGITATASGTYEAGSEPQNTVNGSGLNEDDQHSIDLNDMWLGTPNGGEPLWIQYEFDHAYKLHELWVWNYNIAFEKVVGFGIKSTALEYSLDGQTWTSFGDVELAQATSSSSYTHNTTIDLDGVVAKFVRLTVNSGYGFLGQYGLSEVRFFYIPVQAGQPEPASAAFDVPVDTILDWRGGRDAASHEIMLGTDPEALTLVDTVTETQYDPGTLDLGTTYYWRVDEVNEAIDPTVWEGQLWSFSTQAYFVIDDFERYTNDIDAGGTIFQTWIDGFEDSSNGGSQVGYIDAPFAERTIVHGGSQAMPLLFDNTVAATSVADLSLDGQDWTQAGVQSLVLFFRGDAGNTGGQFYVEINGTKVLYPGSATVLTKPIWKQWNIDLASVGTNLRSVNTLSVGVDGGGSGLVFVDDIRLYRSAPPLPTPEDPGTTDLLAWYTFDNGAADSSGNGYDGTLLGDAVVMDGVLALDGSDDAVAMPRIGGDAATFSTFSYAMRVNPTSSLTSIQYSGGINSDGWDTGGVHFKFHNGALNVGINGLGTGDLEGSTIVPTGVWSHIAVTVSETQIVIYLNGEVEDSRNIAAPLTNLVLGGATIGAWNNSGTIEREMPGEMDDIRVYDRALSAGEVLFLAEL